jgi:DNA-nicking Smr family endonuclease
MIPSCDLHGYTTHEALKHVQVFLETHERLGTPSVHIITGKGHHSHEGRGILREVIKQYLFTNRYIFRQAPLDLGGSGAFIVTLFKK